MPVQRGEHRLLFHYSICPHQDSLMIALNRPGNPYRHKHRRANNIGGQKGVPNLFDILFSSLPSAPPPHCNVLPLPTTQHIPLPYRTIPIFSRHTYSKSPLPHCNTPAAGFCVSQSGSFPPLRYVSFPFLFPPQHQPIPSLYHTTHLQRLFATPRLFSSPSRAITTLPH